ncbi:MAG: EVE domain-containing protein [Phycisphaerae bacterium]|nr:EVE domain-containing protein [Phycisphaerae bacterium]
MRDRRARWSGVRNPAALSHLRGARVGDVALIYHTGSERAAVGLAAVSRAAYEDPDRAGLNDRGEPRFAVIDLLPLRPLARPVTLHEMKSDPRFADFLLLRIPRLSVMPVPTAIARAILERAGE